MADSESTDSSGEKGSSDFRLAAIGESTLSAPLLCIGGIEVVEHSQDPAMSARAVFGAGYLV